MPTTDGQTESDPAISHVNGIFESCQGARSPATQQNPLDSEDYMDLPTYVSLMAEQSQTSSTVIRTEDGAEPSRAEAEKLEEPEEKQGRDKDITDVDPYREATVLVLSSNHDPLADSNNSRDESPDQHLPGHTTRLCDSTNDSNATESENNEEESDVAMPLNPAVDDEIEDFPLAPAHAPPVTPPFPGDLRREATQRGGLVGSKIMKRSSSVISDSGIESEPSSVAWPLEAPLRGRPPLDFSSEREIPQQLACRRPVHRSSLEGLQMESNGSAGIQASLTSISSLPYEEDQQQRKLSKLTKSVSAPQISSPEDVEEDRVLRNPETDSTRAVQHQDSTKINGSEQLESSLLEANSTQNLGLILKENIISEKSNSDKNLSKTNGTESGLNSASEVLLLQESIESPHVKVSTVIGSQRENMNHQTHMSGSGASEEDVHLLGTEAVPCSCGNTPCVHKSAEAQARINTVGDCQSFHQTEPVSVECLDPSPSPPGLQYANDLPSITIKQRPSNLTGLIANDIASPVEKEPLDCQAKPSKIPNSGLAFVNKKMAEVVNMSVSCAPTCLPFSSALRESPSVSGMSARQATSPITHQPLGSFGIVTSSSLNPLNMDDETNERMLK